MESTINPDRQIESFEITKEGDAEWWNALFRGRREFLENTNWAVADASNIRIKGALAPLMTLPSKKIAILGMRDITIKEKAVIRKIVWSLAFTDPSTIIISGLAVGTDTAVHTAALANKLPNIAVLPTGLDTIYPHTNEQLAEKLTNTPWCGLLTQFPDGTAPNAINFLDRVKTIIAMSDGLIIPCCRAKGTAMMAAKLAADIGVPVLAVPGEPGYTRSEGCRRLIMEGLAKPLMVG